MAAGFQGAEDSLEDLASCELFFWFGEFFGGACFQFGLTDAVQFSCPALRGIIERSSLKTQLQGLCCKSCLQPRLSAGSLSSLRSRHCPNTWEETDIVAKRLVPCCRWQPPMWDHSVA